MPDKNRGTVDSRFNKVVTADPVTGSLTNSRPPSPPCPKASAKTASPFSRSSDEHV